MDSLIPYPLQRWTATLLILAIFYLKVLYFETHFAITYLMSFYILKTSIGFMTPKGIPSIMEEDDESQFDLPTTTK